MAFSPSFFIGHRLLWKTHTLVLRCATRSQL